MKNAFCLALLLLVSVACGPVPTLMPTAVPPGVTASADARPELPTAIPSPTRYLPPTWTPAAALSIPSPAPTGLPLSPADLESVLAETGDFEIGVPGIIRTSLSGYSVADLLLESPTGALVFEQFVELDGFVAVAFYQSREESKGTYKSLANWMHDTAVDDYADGTRVSAGGFPAGEDGYVVELCVPSSAVWDSAADLHVPGGKDTSQWIPGAPLDQYVTYLVFTRCGTITYLQMRSSLSRVRPYVARLDARLVPVACGP